MTRARWIGALSVVAIAAIVLTPLVSLALIAMHGDTEIWSHLIRYVVPNALMQTAGLLGGVALVTGPVGIGAAWLVTAYRFPFRDGLAWLLALPLAVPTYLVAYIYGDLLSAAGPVQGAVRDVAGSAALAYFPEIRSVPGAALVMGFVLYPYVYLSARAMFQTQSAALIEA
ncbi:MAG: iron ABC transporter permease, partial [Rhizobiales bacterium]|nr:iron ABC transporter permease [Hyphomicrobiales bacterium]